MTYSTIPNDKLRELCIKNGWFTCGTNTQYERLFQANTDRMSAESIATIIWICSDNADHNSILATLKSARAAWTRSLVTIPEKSPSAKDKVLAEIESAQTLEELFGARAMMCGNDSLTHQDFIDCHNAFVLKRAELKGVTV